MNEQDMYIFNRSINESQARHAEAHPNDFPDDDWGIDSDVTEVD